MNNAEHHLHFPISIRQKFIDKLTVLAPVVTIFAIVFSLALIKNVYDTSVHAKAYGKAAITELEHYIENTAEELSKINQKISGDCRHDDVQLLRSYVFHSPMAKEVSVFNSEGWVYCSSNDGRTDLPMVTNVLGRLQKDAKLTTISLAESNSHEQAIFIYSATQYMNGINALLPPEQFLHLVSTQFEELHYGYEVEVLNQTIKNHSGRVENTYRSYPFRSARYPISITLHLTAQSYFTHFEQHFWQVIFMASLISVLYQAIHTYKLTRNSMGFSLKEAITNNELELNFQPIVDIKRTHIVGSEALLRWKNRDHGYISPTIFIPLAERMQLIDQITYRVFDLVTDFVQQHPHIVHDQYISINLSRTLVIDDKFIDYLQRYTQNNPNIVPLLLLEITEDNDFSAQELVTAKENLDRLKSWGFKIAMDDFGTGYSGLNFIHQHAFHTIKIDQVFIKGLGQNSAIHSVLVSMVKLAKQLNMGVIAEGVETNDQVEHLRSLGVRYIQGFYYSQPLIAEDYLRKLTAQMDLG